MTRTLPRQLRPAALATLAAVAATTAALAAPASADARATVKLAPKCYLSGERGELRGSGFKPNATWTAKVRGRVRIGTGRTDARGRIDARFTAPIYRGTSGTREVGLTVTDGPNVASTTFVLTPLAASFEPRTGDPATLRVRWRVLGVGPDRGVYVHYVQPDGRFKRTIRIGTSRGPCGAVKTGPIALFPFRYSYGRWTFQVDTRRRYSRATLPRLLIEFDVERPRAERDPAPDRDPAPGEDDAS